MCRLIDGGSPPGLPVLPPAGAVGQDATAKSR
jgi:hypothetical protein